MKCLPRLLPSLAQRLTREGRPSGGTSHRGPLLGILALALSASDSAAADWSMWGGSAARNLVAGGDASPPAEFDPDTGTNLRWSVELGSQTFASPVVAGGRVFIGTNNQTPRNEELTGDRGILMAFNAADGQFLWQLAVPKLPDRVNDWPIIGVTSSPAIVGDRGFVVTNRCEVVCFDVAGMADGNQGMQEEDVYIAGEMDAFLDDPGSVDRGALYQPGAADADILWVYDMRREIGVHPHCTSNCSVLAADGKIYVATSNGVDESHINLPAPNVPSLICLDPATGALLGEQEPLGDVPANEGNKLFHGTWSSPAFAEIGGRPQIIFGGGNGWLYGLSPDGAPGGGGINLLNEFWRYDANPPEYRKDSQGNWIPFLFGGNGPSGIVSTPVAYDGLVYTAIGQDPEHGEGVGMLSCIDPAGNGDLSGNAVWTFKEIRRSLSTPAIVGGLLYIADYSGFVYCLDAKTGEKYWQYDMLAAAWGSPLVAGDKVYICDEDGELSIINTGTEFNSAEVEEIEFPTSIYATPVAVGTTLYIATRSRLYAFEDPSAVPLKILDISIAAGTGDVRLKFTARPGSTYTIFRSQTPGDWSILDNNFPAGGAAGSEATFVDEGAALDEDIYFYSIGENP